MCLRGETVIPARKSTDERPVDEQRTEPYVEESPASETSPLLQRIGRFEVRERLGEGAFGVVYRAYDPQLDREVALKVAKASQLSTPDRVERFEREAKAAAQLRHPAIVPLFETGADGDQHFIAAAFIPGHTLAVVIAESKGPLELRRAAQIIRTLAEALAYAHRQGVVHRDVKPANILLDGQDEPLSRGIAPL